MEPYPFREYPVQQQPGLVPTPGQLAQIRRKFGMFIHFGINTFNNTEWSDGTLPIESYRPTAIDADSWVRTAYEAGMNYVILITKHHDGFCLWNTDTTQYSVKYSPNPTDVVAAVSKACAKYGIKLGLYYSLWIGTKRAIRITKPMFNTWKSRSASCWTAATERWWSSGSTVHGISRAATGSWIGFIIWSKPCSLCAKSA